MAEAQFRNASDERTIFSDLKTPDGRTVEVDGGEKFEVGAVLHPLALLHEAVEAVNAEAKKLVAEARKALKDGNTEAATEEPVVEAPVEEVEPPA